MAAGDAGAVTVVLPDALTRLFADARTSLELRAATFADVVSELDRRWPGMRDRLCDSSPRVRRNINVFVRGRRIGLDAQLRAGDVVTIMTGVIG
jgi:molybdopterin converting factor small subunit